MANEHWFDTRKKALVRDAPRRSLLGAATALVAGLALGAVPVGEAAKNRKKHKTFKRNGKKDKPNPAPSCSGGACARTWAGDEEEIAYCEFVCEQCDGADPREFCILKPSSGDKVAWCCAEDAPCCGNWCCSDSCCDPGRGRRQVCITDEFECCPDDLASGVCDLATHICCPGVGCIEGFECPDNECWETCVEPGLECCDGACVVTRSNRLHCGGCGQVCEGPTPQCCGFDCVDSNFDDDHCGDFCVDCSSLPANRPTCCHGFCLFAGWECCRDHTRPPLSCAPHSACCTNAAGEPDCCLR